MKTSVKCTKKDGQYLISTDFRYLRITQLLSQLVRSQNQLVNSLKFSGYELNFEGTTHRVSVKPKTTFKYNTNAMNIYGEN